MVTAHHVLTVSPFGKGGLRGICTATCNRHCIKEISPSPSFPKRGNSDFNLQIVILLISTFLLSFAPSLHAQEPPRAGTIFSATQAPLWAAKEGRYFEKYAIKNLEVIQFSGGQPVTRALIGGDIQISTTGGAAVVNARLKGADTVIIAPTVGVFPYTLYVSKEIPTPQT